VILVVFVVAAALLVDVGTRSPVSGVSQPTTTTTTTTHTTGAKKGATSTTAPATTTTLARSTTSVQVANGSTGAGLAAHFSALLSAQGWATKTPANATAQVATSSVYYAPGQQEAAAAIATELKLQPTAVHPVTSAVPVAGATGDDVVVVIGADLANQGSS
jgi:hypothetical protein